MLSAKVCNKNDISKKFLWYFQNIIKIWEKYPKSSSKLPFLNYFMNENEKKYDIFCVIRRKRLFLSKKYQKSSSKAQKSLT